jgi:SAM-dependent methyltransferase
VDTDGWDDFHRRWAGLKPPLRPDPSVVGAIGGLIADHDEQTLLLGVTPEISVLGRRLIAVDWCEQTIARIWPGDDERRRVVCADWRDMPLAQASVSAAIGDGSPVTLISPDGHAALFAELARVMRPGGRIVLRCYLTPEGCESVGTVREAVLAGGVGFHALKWRLAVALVAEAGDPNIAVVRIHEAFERLFPDRPALARATGWSLAQIAEIDAYRNSPARFSFPTAERMLGALPPEFVEGRFVAAGDYELAERCPLLTAERR